jgi:hypothetical protein
MKCTFTGFVVAVSCIASVSAEAASYEVIPTSYERNVLNSSYTYVATIFDNMDGKVFVCSVTHTEISGKALTYSCRDRSKELRSALAPSADLTTTVQASNLLGPLPSAAFWQINAKSGDLQFCLAFQGDSGDLYRPTEGCIKLDWKSPSRSERAPAAGGRAGN